MDVWFRKYLGRGGDVYQNLRNIRQDRYLFDPRVQLDRAFTVVEHISSAETHVYFPPGNDVLAAKCDAVPCPPLNLDSPDMMLLSVEELPAVPGYTDTKFL